MAKPESLPKRAEGQGDSDPGNRVDPLAQSFVERLRRGERPSISQYVARHPELADEIRELFPTLAMLEQCAAGEEPASGKRAAEPTAGVPRQLGPYRIIREAGRGGMGVVFEAEHETMRRRVALKVLPTGVAASGTHLQRFHREARAAGRLHHTNIVPVFEVGTDDGIYYYAMQFIRGQSLDLVFDELRRIKCRGAETLVAQHPGDAPTDAPAGWGHSVAAGLLTGRFSKPLPLVDEEAERDEEAGRDERDEVTERAGEQPVAERRVTEPHVTVEPKNSTSNDLPAVSAATTGRLGRSSSDYSASDLLQASSDASEPGRDDYFRRIAGIGLQVAEALEYAHGQGIVHRDIKPSNLILDTAGVVWVTDFGLAKHEGDDLTRTGDVVGTLRYMAPERLRGHGDARSDVYGLGLTLYELCTLQHAVPQGDRGHLIHEVTQGEPPRPRKINPQVPRDLETIVLKAIEKDPARRYASAEALAEDLRLFIGDRPIRARQSSSVERVWRWCRRNPRLATLTASVLLLLLVIFGGSLLFAYSARQQAQALVQESLKSNRWLYYYCVGQAEAGRGTGRPGQRFKGLEAIDRAAGLLPLLDYPEAEEVEQRRRLRNEAIACLSLVDVRVVHQRREPSARTAAAAYDADYRRFAQGDAHGNIVIRQVDDNRELAYLPGPGRRAWVLRFSPDGQYLAAKYHLENGPAQWQVWNLETRTPVLQFDRHHRQAPLVFDPGSTRVALGSRDRQVQIYRLSDGQLETSLALPRLPLDVVFSEAGNLAVADGSREFRIYRRGKEPPRVVQAAAGVYASFWTSAGDRLAVAADDGYIYLYDGQRLDAREPEVLKGHRGPVVRLLINQAGDRLASYSWDGTTRLWDLTTNQELLRADTVELLPGGFGRDDRKLAFRSPVKGFGVWEIVESGPLQVGHGSSANQWVVCFCPQVPWLLLSGTDQGLEFWDARTARLLATADWDRVRSIRFTGDGAAFLTSGNRGVHRWPLSVNAAGAVTVGRPQEVQAGFAERMSVSQSGPEVFLAVDRGPRLGQLLSLDGVRKAVEIVHDNLDRVVLSPDGKWLVTATWSGQGVFVWDTSTGKMVCDLQPQSDSATPAFSPDGKWLATADGQQQCLWEVATWKPRYRLERGMPDGWPGPVAFAPDSRTLALARSRHLLELLDVKSGQQLAQLESALSESLGDAAFSKDGSQLAVVAGGRLQFWDLRMLRQQLVGLQLDWPQPAIPPSLEESGTPSSEVPQVTVRIQMTQ